MSTLSRVFESGKQLLWVASAAGFVYNSIGSIQNAATELMANQSQQDPFLQDQCRPNPTVLVGLIAGSALTAGYLFRRYYAAPTQKGDTAGEMSDTFIKAICLLKAKEQLSQVNLEEMTTLLNEFGTYLQQLPHGKEIMEHLSQMKIPSTDGYIYEAVRQMIQTDLKDIELNSTHLMAATLFISISCILYKLDKSSTQGANNVI